MVSSSAGPSTPYDPVYGDRSDDEFGWLTAAQLFLSRLDGAPDARHHLGDLLHRNAVDLGVRDHGAKQVGVCGLDRPVRRDRDRPALTRAQARVGRHHLVAS